MYRYVSDTEKAIAKAVSFNLFMQAEYPLDAMRESKSSSRWRYDHHVVFTADGYYVNAKSGFYHGDGIEFLMKYKGLEYPDAVAMLYAYATERASTNT